jgi:hypothetical protein
MIGAKWLRLLQEIASSRIAVGAGEDATRSEERGVAKARWCQTVTPAAILIADTAAPNTLEEAGAISRKRGMDLDCRMMILALCKR